MSRKWPKAEEISLARYVDDDFEQWLPLPGINIVDLEEQSDGLRQIVEEIYNALTQKNIQYAREKYRPDDRSQEIRVPVEILGKDGEGGNGTCLDLSVLFAGICLGNDLRPVVMVTEGHAYVLVSVTTGKRDWESLGRKELGVFKDALVDVDHIDELRNLVESLAYIAVECTGFAASTSLPDTAPEGRGRGEDGRLSFERAVEAGREQLMSEDDRLQLRFALDVAVAHYRGDIEPPPAEPDKITVQTGATVADTAEVAEDFEGTLADRTPEISMDLTSKHGAVADPASSMPATYALPRPVKPRARPAKGFVGRGRERLRIKRAAEDGDVILCHGAPGSGKTALLRAVAWGDTAGYADGVVYLDVADGESVADSLQGLHGSFFFTDEPMKASAQTIGRDLQGIEALIILDDVTFTEHELEEITNALPRSSFVLASEAATEIEFIKRIEVGGLDADDALVFLERQLEDPISEQERVAAREICKALGGHPGLIIEAANALQNRAGALSLAELSDKLQSTAADAGALAADLAETLPPMAQQAVSALAAAGTTVRAEVLAAAMGGDIGDQLRELVQTQRVESHSPRYSLPGTLVSGVRSQWGPSEWMGELLSSLADWAESGDATTRKINEDREFILRAMEWGIEAERWSDVLRVAKSVDKALAVGAMWGLWEKSLRMGLEAAGQLGDESSKAWILHQLGTRSIGLGDEAAAIAFLDDALERRIRLGERKAARVTRHNLRLTLPLPLMAPAALLIGAVLAIILMAPPVSAWPSAWTRTLEFDPPTLSFSDDTKLRTTVLSNNSDKTISDVVLTIAGSQQFAFEKATPVEESFAVGILAAGSWAGTGLAQASASTPACELGEEGRKVLATLAPGAGCRITVRFTRTSAEVPPAELVARKDDNKWPAELVAEPGDPDGTTTTTINGSTTTPGMGRIIVGIQTVPDGSSATFEFGGDETATLGDDGTKSVDVDPGQYSSTETVPAGWDLTAIVCDHPNSTGTLSSATATFDVEEGETVTCTFTNTRKPDSADLVVTYRVSRDRVAAGQTLGYVITVHNHGPAPAGNVRVSAALPGEVTLASVSSSQGSCSTLPCNLGTVNARASATIVLETVISAGAVEGAVLTSTATVDSDVNDPNKANNTASARTRVQAAIGLIDIDRETIEFGDAPGSEQLSLTNVGVIDVTISGHSIADPFNAEGCAGTTLTPGESCVITVMFPASGGAWCEVLEVTHSGEGDRRALIKGGI